MVVVASAAPASAGTNSFRGFNWAQLGDNYTDGLLVVQGLSSSDSYETVRVDVNRTATSARSSGFARVIRSPESCSTAISPLSCDTGSIGAIPLGRLETAARCFHNPSRDRPRGSGSRPRALTAVLA